MFFTIVLDVLVAAYILSRQRRIRIVPRLLSLRFPVVLGIIGVINLLGYTNTHHHITTVTTCSSWPRSPSARSSSVPSGP